MTLVLEVKSLTRTYSPFLYKAAKFFKINALVKRYEGKVITAVNNISFTVKAGEICGFLGPNGAGKSTTIKAITGLIKIDGGEISVAGKKRHKDTLNDVGAVIESPDMYKNLSGLDNLRYYAALRGGVSAERIDEVLRITGLKERAKDKFGAYSMGMKQRLGICQAIMHKPKLLLLDEPANGLDPQGIIELRKLLKKLARDENIAILVSSHQLAEMQQMCDRVIIMNKGSIIAEKSIDEVSGIDGSVSVALSADKPEDAIAIIKKQYGLDAVTDNDKVVLKIDKKLVPELTKELLLQGVMISGVKIEEKTLEDLFVELTERVQ